MKRAVRTIIRLIAGGLMVFGGLQAGLEFARHRLKETEASPGQYVIGSLLIAMGVALLIFSSRIAARLTEDYDEN
jgi:cytochrome c biogenesis protein CcdA